MENLVVSLETAKKLKAAGFPQETFALWYDDWLQKSWRVGIRPVSPHEKDFAAPTAQEIADQLPIGGLHIGRFPDARAIDKPWQAYLLNDLERRRADVYGDTMAEALALLYLKLNA